jgi:hypothetical protein
MSKEQTKDNNIENDFDPQEGENKIVENQEEIAEDEMKSLNEGLTSPRFASYGVIRICFASFS